ncbi:hypothetical protein CJF30_00006925 [Rutstroemia sp. NJR-2017a BBW]|nr:hypothetical protein CJF30_00006925 [Rutstroemia sp. NJR-2017a BBW]
MYPGRILTMRIQRSG